MAKVIIGIHGLGNKPPKGLIEHWWKLAIREGFEKAGLAVPKFKFELVYWADLVYDKPENFEEKDEESPYFLEEPYHRSTNKKLEPKDNSFRKKVLQFIENQLEKVFLNEDLSLNYHSVTDAIMRKYFKELEMYYGEEDANRELQKETRKRLMNTLRKYQYDDVLLIGHSMGSIIAYDLLQFELSKFSIHTFVTMGSPLGLPFIRSKIADELKRKNLGLNICTPNSISNSWYNFADLEDKIALNFDLNNDFTPNLFGNQVKDIEITNDYETDGKRNPHKAFGYLRSKEFIDVLNTFIKEKRKFSVGVWLNRIKKISHTIRKQKPTY